jgi:hypothetical protein
MMPISCNCEDLVAPVHRTKTRATERLDYGFIPGWNWDTVPIGTCSHFTCTTTGGCHVPSPGGRIDGASVFGQ